ncbi:MAG: hypothetical protein EHM93_15970 [Bacteroidales bacterium]|nr:MAG: hypothetical protein EHM93_15970 [Bacteroidales bacterium]
MNHFRPKVFQRATKVKGIGFKKGQFYIYSEYGGVNPQINPYAKPDIPIQGVNKHILISSLYTLQYAHSQYIDELLDNPRLYYRINKTYGKLYIDDCIKLLSEENSKSFKSISIFGFQFSRQRLLFVFLFFFLFASAGIYLSVMQAKKIGLKIISTVNEDDVLFMLIEKKTLRFFIWCLSPFIVVLMNYEFGISSIMSIILSISILIIVMYLNIKSFILSSNL